MGKSPIIVIPILKVSFSVFKIEDTYSKNELINVESDNE